MDYLQYCIEKVWNLYLNVSMCFKPYYKWITFNTDCVWELRGSVFRASFKPYYKWITFNTLIKSQVGFDFD